MLMLQLLYNTNDNPHLILHIVMDSHWLLFYDPQTLQLQYELSIEFSFYLIQIA